MSKAKLFYIPGTVMWAKVKSPDDKFGKYTLDLYPTTQGWERFNESGLRLKIRENENGGQYIKLSRKPEIEIKGEMVQFGKPDVILYNEETQETTPFEGLVGNGSEAICSVLVYDTRAGLGHRLETVAVTSLVEYEGGVEKSDPDMPF